MERDRERGPWYRLILDLRPPVPGEWERVRGLTGIRVSPETNEAWSGLPPASDLSLRPVGPFSVDTILHIWQLDRELFFAVRLEFHAEPVEDALPLLRTGHDKKLCPLSGCPDRETCFHLNMFRGYDHIAGMSLRREEILYLAICLRLGERPSISDIEAAQNSTYLIQIPHGKAPVHSKRCGSCGGKSFVDEIVNPGLGKTLWQARCKTCGAIVAETSDSKELYELTLFRISSAGWPRCSKCGFRWFIAVIVPLTPDGALRLFVYRCPRCLSILYHGPVRMPDESPYMSAVSSLVGESDAAVKRRSEISPTQPAVQFLTPDQKWYPEFADEIAESLKWASTPEGCEEFMGFLFEFLKDVDAVIRNVRKKSTPSPPTSDA